jgi:hypothetical protein
MGVGGLGSTLTKDLIVSAPRHSHSVSNGSVCSHESFTPISQEIGISPVVSRGNFGLSRPVEHDSSDWCRGDVNFPCTGRTRFNYDIDVDNEDGSWHFNDSDNISGKKNTVFHERNCRKSNEKRITEIINSILENQKLQLTENRHVQRRIQIQLGNIKEQQETATRSLAEHFVDLQVKCKEMAEDIADIRSVKVDLCALKETVSAVNSKVDVEVAELKKEMHTLKSKLEQKENCVSAIQNQQSSVNMHTAANPLTSVIPQTSVNMETENSNDAVRGLQKKKISKLKLPTYDGSYHAEQFCQQAKQIALHNDWSEVEFVCNLSTVLQGQAQRIKDLFPSQVTITSKMLLDALLIRFGAQLSSEDASSRLSLRRQNKGESLRQLGLEIESLVNHAHPLADVATKEEISIREFIPAIFSDELRKQVALKRPKTLRGAMQTAEEVKATLNHFSHSKNVVVMTTSGSGDESDSRGLNRDKGNGASDWHASDSAIRAQLDFLTKKVEEVSRKSSPFGVREVQSEGRHAYLPPHMRDSNSHNAPPNNFSAVRKCFSCGKEGHIFKNCGQRQGNGGPQGARGGVRRDS